MDHAGTGDEISQCQTTTITLTTAKALSSKTNQHTNQGMNDIRTSNVYKKIET